MTTTIQFEKQTKALIDDLKSVCANYGLGNDGNEFKIITQVFLYKFMNDKFGYEVKQLELKLKSAESWEHAIAKYSDKQFVHPAKFAQKWWSGSRFPAGQPVSPDAAR